MGFFDRLFAEVHVPGADGIRILDVPSAMNLRELGGYETPEGSTQAHRFLRCGSTRCLDHRDRAYLREYGLTHVLDLRGSSEAPEATCVYAHEKGVIWRNVELFGQNLSDPAIVTANGSLDYLAGGYWRMLANHDAIYNALSFLAAVPVRECALFHCAAGMDRTGIVAMLLLGLAGVSRTDIIKDYLYSYASVSEVDHFVATGEAQRKGIYVRLNGRQRTISGVYDTLVKNYGGIRQYLAACGMSDSTLDRLRARLLEA